MQVKELPDNFPKIVCLCGSVKFADAFNKAQIEETLKGNIVLTIGCNMKTDKETFGSLSEVVLRNIKERLDELHKRKIDLADEVLFLNIDEYIGESTKSELQYSKVAGKKIRYLNPFGAPYLRDPESPCNCFEPTKLYGVWALPECKSDGHSLCNECRFKAPQTDEERRIVNERLQRK